MEAMNYLANFLMAGLAWVMTYTGLPVEPAVILAVLMMLDFFSGIGRAYAIGEQITSRRMKAGAVGKMLMLLLPLATALAAKGMGADWKWLIEWVVNLMILAELYSFVANIYTMRTKNDLPEWDVVAIIGKKLSKLIEQMIDIR